jgi:tRNA nucleotidyltransferase/poly(A) polymerase
MPDYIYLLDNRLSADQQSALRQLREAARAVGTILFLTGDAVRDLTSGHAVRDLEVAVHGDALNLKKTIEEHGGKVWGEDQATRALYLCFPGTVRVDLVSTHRVEIPKPGKFIYHPASIQEDLRRRDFTVNAMAISLNEGSFGLLMDPMNGAADIESRTLRLVSNYGFLEEPSLLIRATRYIARLGWELDPKTRTRYDNAREEGVIEHLSAQARSRELEQIGHEEEGLKVLQALEAEGWMKFLFPAWTVAKADAESLTALHDLAVDLLLQGVHADMSAAQIRLLTAHLTPKELTALKKLMLRPGFVEEWNSLDALAAGFAQLLLAAENATPSASYKLFTSYDPEAILWLGFTSKDEAVKERFNLFLKVWPELRQRIPHALLQEMRITAELPAYHEIVQAVFLELLDGRLAAPEELRAFLEPHSPPAPPPQVTIKRPRAKRGADAKLKEDSFDDDEESEDHVGDDEDLDDIGGDDDDLELSLPSVNLHIDLLEESHPFTAAVEDEDEENDEDVHLKPVPMPALKTKQVKLVSEPSAEPKPVPPPVEAEKTAALPAALQTEKAEKSAPAPQPKVGLKSKSKPVPVPLGKSTASAGATSHAPGTKAKPASVQTRKLVSQAKPAIKGAPGKATAKPPIKAPVKATIKAAQKSPVKASVKAAQKPPVKAPVKASAPKSASAKKKKISAPNPKSVKAVKKLAPKPAKKR